MSYNDGKAHLDFYDEANDKKEIIAEQFSEGDSLLKKTLLELWKKGIKTRACCKGHFNYEESSDTIRINFDGTITPSKRYSKPYIDLTITINSLGLIRNILKYFYSHDSEAKITFSFYGNQPTFTITMSSDEEKNDYLNFINNYLNGKLQSNDSEYRIISLIYRLENIINMIDNSANQIILQKNQILISIERVSNPNSYYASSNILALEDWLTKIKFSGLQIPVLVRCNDVMRDIDTLSELVNTLESQLLPNSDDLGIKK